MESYYDPKRGLSSAYKIYKGQDKLTFEQIKQQVNKQLPAQLNKQKVKTYYFPIVGHGKYSYQADLMFLDSDGGYGIILCLINVITRFAYAYPMKSKADTYENLKQWYKHDCPNVEHLQTDKGSEFTNKKTNDLFKDIDYYQVESDNAQGKIERFNQTIRRLITVYQSAYKTTKWVKVLPDLIYNYNHRFHRSINCSPAEADEVSQYMQELEKYDEAQTQLDKYHVGDKVRILMNKDLFQKGRSEWSTDVYKIQEKKGHRLLVNDTWYQYYQLQLIPAVHTKLFDNNDDVDKVAIRKEKNVKRDLRKEGVDASNIVEK